MKNKNIFDQWVQSSLMTRLVLASVIFIWMVVVVLIMAGTTLVLERPSGALPPATIAASVPTISLNPGAASAGSTVTVHGIGWPASMPVLIYLAGQELPGYAISSALADPNGHFTATFIFPAQPQWANQGVVQIIAQSENDPNISARAYLTVVHLPEPAAATSTPSATAASPIDTPTVAAPTSTTTLPAPAQLTANTNLNVRSGPGTHYPVVASLQSGQTVEITGRSYDSGWWQIQVPGGYGWVSAQYVTAQNAANVPLVQAPAAPTAIVPTATPRPAPTHTPVIIYDWRGEYYNNIHLGGAPVVVRNDQNVNFNWGSGAPAAQVPADNFSARWTRSLYFDGGTYRVHLRMDDGARLWVDDRLALDAWYDGSARDVTGTFYLDRGHHTLRLEYYERSGEASVALWWEKVANPGGDYDDWKGEYFSDRNLDEREFTRNDKEIDFNWGHDAPQNLPHNDFSVRWSREYHFADGRYRFEAQADDGIRVYLDGKRIIDEWHGSNGSTLYTVERNLKGVHKLVVEYYEDIGQARVNFSWRRIGDRPTPTPTPTPTLDPQTLAVKAAINHLAALTGLPISEINIVSVEAVDWPNSLLGIPVDGVSGVEVITPGYRIILAARGQLYEYRADRNGRVLLVPATATPPATPTGSATATSTPTTEPTEEPTATPTTTPTETPTATTTPTPTEEPTATPTSTPTEEPSPTPEPTATPTETPTATSEPPTPTPEPPTATPEPPIPTPEPPTATPTDPAAAAALNAAIADLSSRIGRPEKRIEVASVQAVTWNDTTLGCAPDSAHSEPATIPGYLIFLAAADEQFEYHTNQDGARVKLC